MTVIRWLVISLMIVSINACSSLKVNDDKYLQAKSIPPLKIPPGLSSADISADYPVSENAYANQPKKVSLVPPDIQQ